MEDSTQLKKDFLMFITEYKTLRQRKIYTTKEINCIVEYISDMERVIGKVNIGRLHGRIVTRWDIMENKRYLTYLQGYRSALDSGKEQLISNN